MTTINEIKKAGSAQELIAFGEYEWPRSETQQTIGHLVAKIKQGFGAKTVQDAIDIDDLRTVLDDAFQKSVRDALAATLKSSLDLEYHDWMKSVGSGRSQRLFVHPPMDVDILSNWAADQGLPVADAECRLEEFSDAPCIVIPKLESYFARRHDRLDRLVDLFAELLAYHGRVLVGCNSWAVQFLRQFDDTLMLLGQGDVFPAFGADALAGILEDAIDDTSNFVSVASGKSVFKRDEDGDLNDPFLETLADRSLGLPWVAVEMFLQGIAEAKDEEKNASDKRSWVQLPAACSLPKADKDVFLFALHSLLIHGTRPIEAFEDLLPKRLPNGVWPALERTGYVDLKDGYVSCAVRNYPDIRSELSAAGFNLDKL